jgi:hypothetical protein
MAMEKYGDKSPEFAGTRQFKFIMAIIKSIENPNID